MNLAKDADLGAEAKEAYEGAIDNLLWCFIKSDIPNQRHSKVRWVMAWPVMLSLGFQDRLEQRRPEAMVILAHYGVLMMYYRDSWVVGDAGRFLIKAIASHLGPHWAPWMEYPVSVMTAMESES
jgi:hypothetical protein